MKTYVIKEGVVLVQAGDAYTSARVELEGRALYGRTLTLKLDKPILISANAEIKVYF